MQSNNVFPTLRCVLALVSSVASLQVGAVATDVGIEDPEIKACIVRSMPENTMKQLVTLRLFNGTELIDTTRAELVWKRDDAGLSKAVIRITTPRERAGTAVLAIERSEGNPELYVYVPESRKARRVSGNTVDTSMLGTDFSYEDFSHFQGVATESKTTRLKDQVRLGGHTTYVLETIPTTDSSVYSRILSYIDREQCALAKIEFFAKNEVLIKELVVPRDDVKQTGSRWIPRRVILNDLRRRSSTELLVDKIAIDPEIQETIFNPTRFGAGQ